MNLIGWTIQYPHDFKLIKGNPNADNTSKEWLTDGNFNRVFEKNLIIFAKGHNGFIINYFNYLGEKQIVDSNFSKFNSFFISRFYNSFIGKNKISDSSTTYKKIDGVLFHQFSATVIEESGEILHKACLTSLHNRYFISFSYLYADDNVGQEITLMLDNSKFESKN